MTAPGPAADRVTAVVLAGGTSSRFGTDKLAAAYAGSNLLTAVIGSLDPRWSIVVVGPARPVGRDVRFTRETPALSGPAAALLAGLAATDAGTRAVITLPGDSPRAGRVADVLLAALADHDLVVAVADGRENPLWLGLTGTALTRARDLDPVAWVDRSARSLLRQLDPTLVTVPSDWLADVDVPADLRRSQETEADPALAELEQ